MAAYYLLSFPARPLRLEPGKLYLIGRGDEVHISLAETDVSRRHAEMAWENDGFVLRDLGSRNGTFVNRRKIIAHRLQKGDEIGIGSKRFLFTVMQDETAGPQAFLERRARATELTTAMPAMGSYLPSAGFTGGLADFPLPDLLQSLELSRRSGVLTIHSLGQEGKLFLEGGQVLAASLEEERGEEAFFALLSREAGLFEFEPAPPGAEAVPVEIQRKTSTLLMEAARVADERKQQSPALEKKGEE